MAHQMKEIKEEVVVKEESFGKGEFSVKEGTTIKQEFPVKGELADSPISVLEDE